MTARELIEALEAYEDDTEVLFTYNFGDHQNTTVAAEVRYVEQGRVAPSAYHRMDVVLDDEDDGDKDARSVALLF